MYLWKAAQVLQRSVKAPCPRSLRPNHTTTFTEHHAEVLEVPVIARRSKFMELDAQLSEPIHHSEVQEHGVGFAGSNDEEVIPVGSGKRSSGLQERSRTPVFHK